ncbi:HNH endonuclease signature motif containing protein [Microlunatus sp. Gsoil 973]|uniref:HNH endonuclease signature motif containing protein n=1 Tax=Microlunatus sp. Gsoil 973 TaxID=2672569 RepID=UPI0012B4AC65|nr:HNH endonuclease signature motif containing protein [Microlunatus sp. Gsoil 973]QGN31823.1 DUF222 domain-containing protein [Microlunatus sp. Gsoil 973]
MLETPVYDMDAAETSALLSECIGEEIWAQDRQLILAAHFATLYPPDTLPRAGSTRLAMVGERAVRLGGPGTPLVAEFAPDELAPEIGMSIYQATCLMADAQDLQYRFPGLWQLVLRGEAPGPTVRSVARKTRELSKAQALEIDRHLADKVLAIPRGRFETLLDAAILRVDAAAVKKRIEAAARERFVKTSQSTEYGIKGVYAKLDAPDAIGLDATVDRLADILMSSPRPIPGVAYRNARTREEWRATALGLLRNPLLASKILVEHAQPDLFEDYVSTFEPDPRSLAVPDAPADTVTEAPHDQPDPELRPDDADELPVYEPVEVQPVPDNAPVTLPDDHLDSGRVQRRQLALETLLRAIDPMKLLCPTTLYFHVSEEDWATGGSAVVRSEQAGPVLLDQLRTWFGSGSKIIVKPVIDVARSIPVDAYEIPDPMREIMHLRSPASVFPYSTNLSRNKDLDHTIPYARGGPTEPDDLGPLGRREHRFRTHGRVSLRQPEPGRWVWRTRFGRVLITTSAGTIDLGRGSFGAGVWQAAVQSRRTVGTAA